MAILRMKKLREIGEKERSGRLAELLLDVSKERASSEIGGTVKNPGRIREMRRAVARIHTLEREIEKKKEPKKKR